uniref:Uncharacterized protein n=1 Tax=Octactis speculum TaxID=3111310 RepID=A0A7S2D8N0_9STRA
MIAKRVQTFLFGEQSSLTGLIEHNGRMLTREEIALLGLYNRFPSKSTSRLTTLPTAPGARIGGGTTRPLPSTQSKSMSLSKPMMKPMTASKHAIVNLPRQVDRGPTVAHGRLGESCPSEVTAQTLAPLQAPPSITASIPKRAKKKTSCGWTGK